MHDSQPPSVIELNMTSNIGVSEGKLFRHVNCNQITRVETLMLPPGLPLSPYLFTLLFNKCPPPKSESSQCFILSVFGHFSNIGCQHWSLNESKQIFKTEVLRKELENIDQIELIIVATEATFWFYYKWVKDSGQVSLFEKLHMLLGQDYCPYFHLRRFRKDWIWLLKDKLTWKNISM